MWLAINYEEIRFIHRLIDSGKFWEVHNLSGDKILQKKSDILWLKVSEAVIFCNPFIKAVYTQTWVHWDATNNGSFLVCM